MDKEQLKFNLIRIGVQFDELPNKGESTTFDFVFSLPPNMDWKMAEELLPPDIYKGIRDFHKQHPKLEFRYFNPSDPICDPL